MTIILAVVAIYMAAMLFIGYKAKKSVKSPADFFTGGSRFGSALTAIAHQAAGLSGWLFIAWSQQVAGSGLGAIWTAFSSGFAPFINFFVMAKRVAKFTVMSKARSFIDLLEARYYDEDRKLIRGIATAIIAISITVYMSSQLMAAGTTFQAVLGLDYRVSVLIGAVVVILYTSAGGLLAVAWTDFVQGMLMIFAVIVGLFVAFGNTGSLGFVMDEITAINPALDEPHHDRGPAVRRMAGLHGPAPDRADVHGHEGSRLLQAGRRDRRDHRRVPAVRLLPGEPVLHCAFPRQ